MRFLFALATCGFVLALLRCSGGESATPDGSAPDATPPGVDLCDAFTGVDTSCPIASPTRCFPDCDAGGCYCRATTAGPRWECITDLSCMPACAPIDDACADGALVE